MRAPRPRHTLLVVVGLVFAFTARTESQTASPEATAAGVAPAVVTTTSAPVVGAPFVGTIRYDMTIQGQAAKGSLMRTEAGDVLVDVTMRDPRIKQSFRTSVVVLSGNPDEAWQIMHQTRTFSRLALTAPDEGAAVDEGRFTVEKSATEQLLDRTAHKAVVTDTVSGDVLTVWLDPSQGDVTTIDRLYRGYQPGAPSFARVLRAHGIDGLPLRFQYFKKSMGQSIDGTATAIEPGVVDENALAPPRGFLRVELPAGSGPLPFLSGPPSAKDVHSVIRSFVGP